MKKTADLNTLTAALRGPSTESAQVAQFTLTVSGQLAELVNPSPYWSSSAAKRKALLDFSAERGVLLLVPRGHVSCPLPVFGSSVTHLMVGAAAVGQSLGLSDLSGERVGFVPPSPARQLLLDFLSGTRRAAYAKAFGTLPYTTDELARAERAANAPLPEPFVCRERLSAPLTDTQGDALLALVTDHQQAFAEDPVSQEWAQREVEASRYFTP